MALLACSGDGHDAREERGERSTALGAPAAATFAKHELAIMRAIAPSYVDRSASYTAPLSTGLSARVWRSRMNTYYRALCSQALFSAVERRERNETIARGDLEVAWVTAAASDFDVATDTNPDTNDAWWLAPAPGLDCLLAASAIAGALDEGTKTSLRAAAESLANRVHDGERFTLSGYRERQRDPGNSQAEEIGLTASYLVAAHHLLPNAARRGEWLARAEELLDYSHQNGGAEGEPRPFADGADLVANHGITPHPVYTQSLLTSYAEIWAVEKQLGREAREAREAPAQLPPAERTSRIGEAIARYTDASFGLTGDFARVGADGSLPASGRFQDQTYTLVHQPAGMQLLMPTTDVGTMSIYYEAASGLVHAYQLRDGDIWKYTCDRGTAVHDCRATFVQPLAKQFEALNEAPVLAAHPLPARDVDALSQFDMNGVIKSYVFKGDRLWHYTCQSGSCTARYTKTLEDLAREVKGREVWTEPLPKRDLDAVSIIYDPIADMTRAYFVQGERIWHYRCKPECTATYDMTLSALFGSVVDDERSGRRPFAGAPLPPSGLRALTQFFNADRALETYVWTSDYVWLYVCKDGTCRSERVATIADHTRRIRHQHAWGERFEPRAPASDWTWGRRVSEWGFDATIQDSAYAYLALRSPADFRDRYAALQAAQVKRHLTIVDGEGGPYFPPRNVDGRWSWGTFVENKPAAASSAYVADFVDTPTLDERVNTHWFLNTLAGFNAAVAYLLLTERSYLTAL
ncbi:MAG: hypothetical protein KIT84_36010 [Labilithrix sp.]|nr:hypothetical protein [Labilithrix sp.]MCW5816459.1 hypothetical protein [Labilithrix sp.]